MGLDIALDLAPSVISGGINPLLLGLQSYWKLDETAASGDVNRADAHGSNTLTSNNSVLSTPGKISNGIAVVAADNEFLSRAHASCVGLTWGTGNYAVACWLYLNSHPTTYSCFMSKGGVNATIGGYQLMVRDTGNLAIRVSDGTNTVLDNGIVAGITLSAWFFVVLNVNRTTNLITIVVNNGTPDTMDISTVGSIAGTSIFKIGEDQLSTYNFDGVIDEVGMWNRELTTAEISKLWNSGNGLAYPFV